MELVQGNSNSAGPAIVFLPGIVAPAVARYEALIRELGPGVRAFTKELEIYRADSPPHGYSIALEVSGLLAAVDAAGIDRFFLYGHSAGGAISLAFAAEHPARLLGLALDEPASDFHDETKASWAESFAAVEAMPEDERMAGFLQAQVAEGVELPPPPPGTPPDWMASRPAAIEAFRNALAEHVIPGAFPDIDIPVYYSFGSRTNPVWGEIRARLAATFPGFTAEEYEGLHHLNTSHAAEPGRVAAALRRIWRI